MKNLLRYHREIYFPGWWEDSIASFVKYITSKGAITFSLHSVEKIVDSSFEYGKSLFKFLLRIVRKQILNSDNVFEIYAVGDLIKKVCFRYSSKEFPVDLVLVISADGVVITAYVINKSDNHNTLDKNLYERRP